MFFFFNDTATTEIYTLSLHDALPISPGHGRNGPGAMGAWPCQPRAARSEEHTSELQSPCNLVCRLLLEKKKSLMLSSVMLLMLPLLLWSYMYLAIQHILLKSHCTLSL